MLIKVCMLTNKVNYAKFLTNLIINLTIDFMDIFIFLAFLIAYLGIAVWLLTYIPRRKNAFCNKKYLALLGCLFLWVCSIITSAVMAVYGLNEAWSPFIDVAVKPMGELVMTLWGLGMTFSLLGLYIYVNVFRIDDFMP